MTRSKSVLLLATFALSITTHLSNAFASEEETVETSQFWIESEAGPVWQSRNEVQVPADSGTRFELTSLGRGPALAGRVYLGYRINNQHELRALYAPLTLNLDGTLDASTSFEGKTFAPGISTSASYTFNSYRLTYRYVFKDDESWTLRVGFTAKIRDAKIRLSQGAQSAETSNVGFVPLLHFSAVYHVSPEYVVNFDVDALAAPQGRAEDVAILAGYRPSSRLEYRLGYRTVEGGASGGGNVYTFAWLHYGVAGLRYDF